MKDPAQFFEKIWRYLLIAAVTAGLGLRFFAARNRIFNPDEFQHLHGAFSIANGLIPYRDYFEHHTPWLPYLLSWLYPIHADSIEGIFFARYLMIVLVVVIIYLTYLLGAQLFDRSVGIIAALLLCCMKPFVEKSLEIRPDVPQTVCWLAGLYLGFEALQSRRSPAYVLSGLCFGSAIMFSQKAVIGIAGVCAVFAWVGCDPRFEEPLSERLRRMSLFAGGVAIPFLLSCAYFFSVGGLEEFIQYNFIMNATWTSGYDPIELFSDISRRSPFVVSMGLGGFVVAVAVALREPRSRPERLIPLAGAFALVLGAWIVPMLFLQYFVPLFPLWCIFAASLIGRFLAAPDRDTLLARWRNREGRRTIILWSVLSIGVLALHAVLLRDTFARGLDRPPYYGWMLGLLLLCIPVAWLRSPGLRVSTFAAVFGLAFVFTPLGNLGVYFVVPAAIATALNYGLRPRLILVNLFLVWILALPFVSIRRVSFSPSNQRILREFEFVHEFTRVDEPIFTGWWHSPPFRPHAYFYFFLHQEMRSTLTKDERGRNIVAILEAKKPKLVVYDRAVQALEPSVQEYIKGHYKPVWVGQLWYRYR